MNFSARRFTGAVQWFRFCAVLALMLAQSAWATDDLWPPADQLGQAFNYTIPGNPPPTIDATAFDNENQFIINFEAVSLFNNVINPEIFETWNTINYTNNGLMVANAPLSTNGVFFLFSPGCGFNFDTQTTNVTSRKMAGTFYNPGIVRVNSVLDTGSSFFSLATIGKFNAWATNIINHGQVLLGYEGLMQFTGKNVDLTHSELAIEGANTFFINLGFLTTTFANANYVSLDYGIGTDTNQDWDPSIFLQPNFAISSEFNSQLAFFNQMIVTNSVSFFRQNTSGTNYILTRAIFLNSNPGQNVTQKAYLGGNANPYLGPGGGTIEWSGSYLDPATGQLATNYLYLNDYFIRGGNTNNQVFNGLPSNFTITELSSPAAFTVGASPTNFPTILPGVVTNNYSYVDLKLTPSSTATNASLQNPSGALTNLPGRIQIVANNDLDLTLAHISGANYMSLASTNNFKGSAGASIFSPYSDINLGVTNGFLSVSNLLAPNSPNWNGTLQAWSSDWFVVDANGVTNEYRVVLVNANLIPTTPPVVQNLTLHSTNLFVSDVFNVIGKLSIDATRLTVTTNLNTDGFGSPDGEINWYYPSALNSVQFPNLRWVTNNGAIRSANLAVFGSPSTIYGAFINNGILADQGSTIYASNFLSSGIVSNGVGSFLLQSQTTTITNGSLLAGGDVSITTGSLLTSNLLLLAGKSLTLQVTNFLSDTGPDPTNNSYWSVGGSTQVGPGFSLPIKPLVGDLLGTTITNIAWTNKVVNDTWAGLDRGYGNSGYSNNAAIGRLILDPIAKYPNTQIHFSGSGTGASNAIYVDCLILQDQATNRDGLGNVVSLTFNTNLVIYYAQAFQNGVSIAEKIDHANTNHLRWMPGYVGYFSSTNLVYPPGVTNVVNAALAISPNYDSDGDGTANSLDPTPFLVPAQLNLNVTVTNRPPLSARIQWNTVPGSTNYVFYKTNLLLPTWSVLTNFASPLPKGPAMSVSVFDALTNTPHFYQVEVVPWLLRP